MLRGFSLPAMYTTAEITMAALIHATGCLGPFKCGTSILVSSFFLSLRFEFESVVSIVVSCRSSLLVIVGLKLSCKSKENEPKTLRSFCIFFKFYKFSQIFA
eukprot:TRINITY_DN13700_c0_g1_i2.p2 TRINITY_DN13700_c0_g1~~TRINITY_DN13700_c0_g1_i2.p2  ORF type:complete len:102 (-),score=11.62 TRINITY_DN13700_c0_g1_i2:7-312(-)